MFDKLFKNTKVMNWVALLTFVVIVLFVVDQYRDKNAFGFYKGKTDKSDGAVKGSPVFTDTKNA